MMCRKTLILLDDLEAYQSPISTSLDEDNQPDLLCPICGFELNRSGHCIRCGYCENC